MQLQFDFDGEAAAKRRKRRKRTDKWLLMSEGAKREERAIRQTMRGPKLLSSSRPRVIPEQPIRQRSPESEFGLKWQPPTERKELADFVGWNTAMGRDAASAEAEFFRTKRRT